MDCCCVPLWTVFNTRIYRRLLLHCCETGGVNAFCSKSPWGLLHVSVDHCVSVWICWSAHQMWSGTCYDECNVTVCGELMLLAAGFWRWWFEWLTIDRSYERLIPGCVCWNSSWKMIVDWFHCLIYGASIRKHVWLRWN